MVDPDGNVWVTDNASGPGLGQQVLKFSPDGVLLMMLGKAGVIGSGLDEFDQPTDVAIAANGDIFVADGHAGRGGETGNARIMKFDQGGTFMRTWGRKGMGPGEFDTIHTIALDSQGRLFVGDRQNNRVQIFDAQGNFIDQWFQFGRPSGIFIDDNDVIYVADSESRDGRSNTGQPSIPPTGYGFNPAARRGDTDREREDWLGHRVHSRPVPVSVCGRADHGRWHHGGCRGQRVRRRLPRHREEVRRAVT